MDELVSWHHMRQAQAVSTTIAIKSIHDLILIELILAVPLPRYHPSFRRVWSSYLLKVQLTGIVAEYIYTTNACTGHRQGTIKYHNAGEEKMNEKSPTVEPSRGGASINMGSKGSGN